MDTRDAVERAVLRFWRQSGWSEGTRIQYLGWVRRFRRHCGSRGADDTNHLTLRNVEEFAHAYVGARMSGPEPVRVLAAADHAVFAWANALRALGHAVPEWRPPSQSASYPPLIAQYVAYRRSQCGIAPSTVPGEAQVATDFLSCLQARGRSLGRASAADLDAFVADQATRLCRRTLRDTCSRLRAFLRFLQVSGRIHRDLASFVVAPRVRPMEKPPRFLPWRDVQRLLRVVRRDSRTGRRDFAVLLLMAVYGFGAAEVRTMQLDDIDWRAGVLRICRPKTAIPIELPLLPAVARALVAYLQRGRPPDAGRREIFISAKLPRRALTSGAVGHIARMHARAAGLDVPVGAHVLRHSHATRQVDAGVDLKTVGDILGHRCPSSTSAYARVALRRLRQVALPVPR